MAEIVTAGIKDGYLIPINQYGFHAIGNAGSSETINFDTAANQSITIDQATSLTLSATYAGNYSLKITNGSAYVITWVTSIKWAGGAEPEWTASGEDWVTFKFDGSNWYGVGTLDFGTV